MTLLKTLYVKNTGLSKIIVPTSQDVQKESFFSTWLNVYFLIYKRPTQYFSRKSFRPSLLLSDSTRKTESSFSIRLNRFKKKGCLISNWFECDGPRIKSFTLCFFHFSIFLCGYPFDIFRHAQSKIQRVGPPDSTLSRLCTITDNSKVPQYLSWHKIKRLPLAGPLLWSIVEKLHSYLQDWHSLFLVVTHTLIIIFQTFTNK